MFKDSLSYPMLMDPHMERSDPHMEGSGVSNPYDLRDQGLFGAFGYTYQELAQLIETHLAGR